MPDMRIPFNSFLAGILLLASPLAAQKASAQHTNKCLYNDVHYHLQNFTAEGPRLSDILTMMDGHICRTTVMGLAVTVAHDPLIGRTSRQSIIVSWGVERLWRNPFQETRILRKDHRWSTEPL